MPNGLTRHHQIAQEHGGSWHEDNLILLPWIPHRAKHILFGNDLPLEIIRTELEIANRQFHPDVYRIMDRALMQVEGIVEAYNPNCYNGTRLKEYLTRSNELRNPPHNRT